MNVLRAHPALFTAVATGVGLLLGLAGRLLRRKARRTPRAIVVVS